MTVFLGYVSEHKGFFKALFFNSGHARILMAEDLVASLKVIESLNS